LKIASIVGEEYYHPILCTNCYNWFNLPQIGKCPHSEDLLAFHEACPESSLNNLTKTEFDIFKQQVQVVDCDTSQETIEQVLMKNNPGIKYIEPQSMNFDKKLKEIYIEYWDYLEKI